MIIYDFKKMTDKEFEHAITTYEDAYSQFKFIMKKVAMFLKKGKREKATKLLLKEGLIRREIESVD